MWYSFSENAAVNLTAVKVDRVKEIIKQNKEGKIVDELVKKESYKPDLGIGFSDVLSEESLDKFDNKVKNRKKRRKPFKSNKYSNRNKQK